MSLERMLDQQPDGFLQNEVATKQLGVSRERASDPEKRPRTVSCSVCPRKALDDVWGRGGDRRDRAGSGPRAGIGCQAFRRVPVKAESSTLPYFIHSPIAASWPNGQSSGASGGADAPTPWKKRGFRGATPRLRHSSRSGTSFREQSTHAADRPTMASSRRRAELRSRACVDCGLLLSSRLG